MAYATQADVEAAIGADFLRSLADIDRDGTLGPTDVAFIERTLDEASSFAETYVGVVAPENVSPALRRAVVNVAVQYMRMARDRTTKDSTAAYKASLDWFTALSDGKASLDTDGDPAVDPGDPELVAEDRIWSRYQARRLL